MTVSKTEQLANAVGPGMRVSRETLETLEGYIALLNEWQKIKNLVSGSTLPEAWLRHIVDSAQLVPIAGEFRTWIDLGSGAGFPGLVMAILYAEDETRRFHLVEANGRKVAFLREVARKLVIPVDIHRARIEEINESDQFQGIDIVSARALASLEELLDLSAPMFRPQTRGLYLKGRDADAEIDAARQRFDFELQRHASSTADDAVILEVTGLTLIS